MAQIIKRGIQPEDILTGSIIPCALCRCEWQIEKRDSRQHIINDAGEHLLYVDCPSCRMLNEIVIEYNTFTQQYEAV